MPSSIDKIYDHLPEVKESSKFTHRKAFRGRALGKGSEFDQLRKLLSIYNECDVKVNENYQLGDAAKGVIYNYFTAGSHLSKRNLQRIALRYIACNTKPSTSRFVFYVMKMQQPLKHYFRQISRRYFYSDKENVWFASENFQFLSEFAARQFSYESMQVLLNRMKLWDKVVKDEDFLPIGKKSCRKAFKQLIVIAKESMMELNIELLTRNFFTKFSQMGHVLSSQTILAEQFYNSEDWISEKFSTMVDHFRSNIAHYTKADQLLAPEQAFADMKKKQLAELELGDPELVGPVDLDHHKEILCNLSIFYMSIALLLAINNKIVVKCCEDISEIINGELDYDNKFSRSFTIMSEAMAIVDKNIAAVRVEFRNMSAEGDTYDDEFIRALVGISYDDDDAPETLSAVFRTNIVNVKDKMPRPHLFKALYNLVIESFALSCYQDTLKIYLLIAQEFGDQGIAKMHTFKGEGEGVQFKGLSIMLLECKLSCKKIKQHMNIMNSCKQPIAIKGDTAVRKTTQSKEIYKTFSRACIQFDNLIDEIQFQIQLKHEHARQGRKFGLAELRRLLKQDKDKFQLSVNEKFDNIKEYTARIQQYVVSEYNPDYDSDQERSNDRETLELIDRKMADMSISVNQRFIATLDSMPE